MNIAHPDMQQIALCVPAGFQSTPVMHAIGAAESAHISRLGAQIAAQTSAIAALRAEAAQKDARINVLSAALRNCNAPACPSEHFAHTYQHPELGELECHLYGEEGEPENGMDELAELRAAYLRGVDIADRLTKDEVERIEIAACAALADAQMEC